MAVLAQGFCVFWGQPWRIGFRDAAGRSSPRSSFRRIAIGPLAETPVAAAAGHACFGHQPLDQGSQGAKVIDCPFAR